MDVIFPLLLVLAISIVVFLVFRAVMLWYWKIDIIVNELEAIKHQVTAQNEYHRKQIRIDYYKAKVLGDKQGAYESLLEIVIDDLLKDGLKNEQRENRYVQIQKKHIENFEKLGYSFPEYSTLFDR
ncbi:MAG: hypothetical protein WC615_04850 [Mucilaginibacter sp.]|jgi:hypothetical protein|uniref:hypothetical protein n=1 Tax=Mucilaginibacter sp. TaxID=1882438 RepID=UPI0035670E17